MVRTCRKFSIGNGSRVIKKAWGPFDPHALYSVFVSYPCAPCAPQSGFWGISRGSFFSCRLSQYAPPSSTVSYWNQRRWPELFAKLPVAFTPHTVRSMGAYTLHIPWFRSHFHIVSTVPRPGRLWVSGGRLVKFDEMFPAVHDVHEFPVLDGGTAFNDHPSFDATSSHFLIMLSDVVPKIGISIVSVA